MFGPPGSGKGTYASRLGPQLGGLAHIATGDIFRAMAKGDGPLSEEIKSYLVKGVLVPDEIVLPIVREELAKPAAQKGFFLDGFPRNLNQAKELEQMTTIDAVLHLIVPQEILVEKALARRICRDCGNMYNIADISRTIDGVSYILPPMSPEVAGICDKCGGELYQREDDNEAVIRDRLQIYENQSKPVMQYLRERGVRFLDVYVIRPPEEMVAKIRQQLEEAGLVPKSQ